jgi:PST family polysaccharide transporter
VDVAIPPPTFEGDPGDPRQLAAFSQRKPVPAALRPDPSAGEADVAARVAGPSSPRVADPIPSSQRATLETGSAAADEHAPQGEPEPRSAISNGLRWNLIGRPIIESANLLGMAVLARLVAPAEFGRYAIALIVLLLSGVPTQAVMYAIVQRNDLDRDHLKTGQTLAILIGLAMCAFCLAASYTIVPVVFGARTALLVRLMIPACFINSVNTVQFALVSRRLEFRRLTLFDMTITLVDLAVAIPLAMMGLNGEAMVLGTVVASVVGYILVCRWVLPPLPSFRLRSARDLLGSGVHAASNAASLVCFQNCDYVIVGARLGPLQAGYYFRAYTLGVVYQTKVSQVMTGLGFPVLSRVSSEDEVNRVRHRMVQTITLVLFPLLTALAIVAPRFVTWFYGPAWHAVVLPVQILTVGGAAMLIAQAVTVALLATGRPRAVMFWGWAHFVAYGGAVFAVARLGLPAVAIAAVVVHTTFLIISYVILFRGCVRQAFKTFAKDVLPAVISSVGFAVVAVPVGLLGLKLGMPMLPYLLAIAVAGGAGYFVSLRLWFPTELRHLCLLAGHLLPTRMHRLFGWFIVRLQPQKAAL